MRVQARAHWEPKAGSHASEYEDAYWPTHVADDALVDDFCCAVADGATESSYSRMWAKQVAQAACHKHWLDEAVLLAHLPQLQRQWAGHVRRRMQQRAQRRATPLPWYVAEKAQQGAHAALLHLQVGGAGGLSTWRALAVGDCCLAQVRNDAIVSLFPFTGSIEFNNRPYLLPSQPVQPAQLSAHIRVISGEWCSGDQFLLMSDALAQWFYRAHENDEQPWRAFNDLEKESSDEFLSFQEWVQVLRAEGAIRNDDVTVMRLVVRSEGE